MNATTSLDLQSGTVAGVLGGAASAAKTTSGTVTLSGANSYTGGTSVSAGTLALSGAGTLGATSGGTTVSGGTLDLGGTSQTQASLNQSGGDVKNGTINVGAYHLTGGTLDAGATVNATTSLDLQSGTVAGVLGGAASAAKTTSGTVTLSGANSYTGGTTITGGTLALAGAGTIASSSGLVDNANFDISALASAGTTVQNLNGSGTVTLGAKTLTVAQGAGSFAGTIGGTGGFTLAAGSLTLTGANSYTGPTTIASGTLQLGNGGTTGSIASNVVDNGTLAFDHSDTETYAGAISGTGKLSQIGTGTTILDGSNTVSGLVSITNGTLEVGDATHTGALLNAASGGVQVGATGTLQGHGTILGAVSNTSGGTVRPGGSIGTLTVGSYTQGANSTFSVDVSPALASELVATGAASINGHFNADFGAGTYGTHIYPVLLGSTVSGKFSSLTTTNAPAGLIYGLYYRPGNQEVDLVLASTKGAAAYGDAMSAGLDAADAFGAAVLDHSDECADSAQGKTMGKLQAACGVNGLWMKALGVSGKTDSGLASGYRSNTAGLMGGIDHHFGHGISAGLTGGWTSGTTHSTDLASGSRTYQYAAGVYGTKRWAMLRLDLDAFYTLSQQHMSRDTQGLGIASAAADGRGFGAAARVSAPLLDGDLTPLAELRFTRQHTDSATESGVDAVDFTMDAQTHSALRALAGARLQHTYLFGETELTPRLELGVEQQLGPVSRTVSGRMTNVENTDFAQAAVAPARTAGVGRIGFSVDGGRGLELYGDVGGRISQNQQEGNVDLGVRLRF